MEDKNKRYQMAFDVSKEVHTEVKVSAALRNISISCWMSRAIHDRLQKENKYDKDES